MAIPVWAFELTEQVIIEAANGVDYDLEKNITIALKEVKLTRGDLIIRADKVTYYGNTGMVEAEGNVKLKNPAGEYRTQKMRYNIFTSSGDLAAFTATLPNQPRDYQLNGKGINLIPEKAEVTNVGITRCPKAKPHYTLKAKWVKIVGKKIQLKNVVFKILEVPVFYFPYLSFYSDIGIPELEPGYNGTDGFTLKGSMTVTHTEDSDWNFKCDLASKKKDSLMGMEYEKRFKNSTNRVNMFYNLDGWGHLGDVYTYQTDLYSFVVDGFQEFSDEQESQMGITITRKYWESPVGKLQMGVLFRKITARDDSASDPDYGGIYNGVRLDYLVNSNLKLSYLGIAAHSSADFRDLIDDFGIGNNLLYEFNMPLQKNVQLKFTGTYNTDESKWYHQIYSISQETCCFRPTIYYDQAEQSLGGSLGFKF